MTIGALNHPTIQTAAGASTASPTAPLTLPGFSGEPVNIHPALEEVRRLPEFQPPSPSPVDEWLKQPWIQKLFKEAGQALEQMLKGIGDIFGRIRPEGIPHLPQNIRDIFSGFIGFLLVLAGLYACYLLITLVLRWQNQKGKPPLEKPRFFEQTLLINSTSHYQQAQQAADKGNYKDGIQALYLATLCLLDETQLMPYELTRTNREYQRGLAEQSRLDLKQAFVNLARVFEGIRYGNQTADLAQFQASHQHYQYFQEKLAVPYA
ncbi:DUF4129 domain-containing protein [Vampirovibrio sp.]|uniref:DUF4129 domain-containing protein n=1 Tax=Vampirovibrio sp. TaxID=2717857 RepID=UPI003593855C